MNAPDILDAALAYARRGWSVLPLHSINAGGCTCGRRACTSPGKHPMTEHGLDAATTDESTIREWLTRWAGANVGIRTGAVSGLVVLDVDPRHGGDASLDELVRRIGPLPETVEVLTGGGGRHLYFRHPGNGQIVRNAAALGGLPGLDLRGDGGYVVAPPSTHASGKRYEWEVSSDPADTPMAAFPSALTDLLAAPAVRAQDGGSDAGRVPEGCRNASLASLAGAMRRLGASRVAIEAGLLADNAERCDPPLAEVEVRAIAGSVSRYPPGVTNPTLGTRNDVAVPHRVAEEGELERLLDVACAFIQTYVHLRLQSQAYAITLWCAHTFCVERFEQSPILAVTSAVMRSGKTRAFDAIELLVWRPWRAVLPSDAVVYRYIEARHPTFLLDEVDAIFGRKADQYEGLRALLNAGNRKGTSVPRVVGQGTKMEVKEFSVFGAKAVAGIGNLPPTVADRAIGIRMERRSKSEPVAKFRRTAADRKAKPIREGLEALLGELDPTTLPAVPDELDDRAAESWEPLLAIADAAGGHWPKRARASAIELNANRDQDDEALSLVLLRDIRDIFIAKQVPRIHSSNLIVELNALETSPWGDFNGKPLSPHGIARLLRPYGIAPTLFRMGTEPPKRGYAAAQFEETFARYVAPSATAHADRYIVTDAEPSLSASTTCNDVTVSESAAEEDDPMFRAALDVFGGAPDETDMGAYG